MNNGLSISRRNAEGDDVLVFKDDGKDWGETKTPSTNLVVTGACHFGPEPSTRLHIKQTKDFCPFCGERLEDLI